MAKFTIMNNYPDFSYDYQLIIKHLFDKVKDWRPDEKIVYRDKFSYTYLDFYKRVHKLANLYKRLGVGQGDMIAVMDWDSHRYLEHYFAVPMMGAILHTVNIRLSPDQMLYTINHAEDKILVVHKDFEPIINKMRLNFETIKHIIYISDGDEYTPAFEAVGEYEALLSNESDVFDFPDFDENTIATTFYTTGTTGNPKGVFFSHRQLVLHTLTTLSTFGTIPQPVGFTQHDIYMPLTPMFHVHAWGVPYVATVMGVKQVYPGKYDEMIVKLLVQHKVTFSHCVPTILQMVVGNPATASLDFSKWKVVIGGSALSKGLAKMAMDRGVKLMTGYGMSETAPILSLTMYRPDVEFLPAEEQLEIITKTGFPITMVQLKVVNEKGQELPRGEKHVGEIVARAPWLTKGYFKVEEKSRELWENGWLHTGDIAYRDHDGYFKITDRLKDVIKSGGEWVSSLEIENLISQCHSISQVAVIGVPDEKWGERPVAFVVHKPQTEPVSEEAACKNILATFVESGKIEKWAVPDHFIVLDDIPKTSVGKIDKKLLRIMYAEKYS
jgi:fatty-acyl-CoA synthase